MDTLRVGLTPCPNDTFLLAPIATGRVARPDLDVQLELHDIETLNQAALRGEFDVVKISCALYAEVRAHYALLDVGAAVVDGYGPLLLARPGVTAADLPRARLVAPGAQTTGAALFRRYAPVAPAPTWRRYDEIMPALAAGEFDAGVVIHEARLTYGAYGLHCVADLGAWWTRTTGLPVALGCLVIRRELAPRIGHAFEALMRAALDAASLDDPTLAAYVAAHAQEMAPAVLREYIALYVTPRTRTLGPRGWAAILALNGLDHAEVA
ncbi:MAG: 1,4-dihydroxy-6-naphthoate synthase [Gammaproteobacteria bacterium]